MIKLSPREKQVFDLLACDKTNAQIAEELGISRNTVQGILCNLYFKLGITFRKGEQLNRVSIIRDHLKKRS